MANLVLLQGRMGRISRGWTQLQALRELSGDYPSSNDNSAAGNTVIPESVFEGVVGDEAQRYPCVTKNDYIVIPEGGREERGR